MLSYWLRFSHINKQKFRQNFEDAPGPMCDCGSEIQTTNHFFLRCSIFTNESENLLNGLFEIDLSLRNLDNELLLKLQNYSGKL